MLFNPLWVQTMLLKENPLQFYCVNYNYITAMKDNTYLCWAVKQTFKARGGMKLVLTILHISFLTFIMYLGVNSTFKHKTYNNTEYVRGLVQMHEKICFCHEKNRFWGLIPTHSWMIESANTVTSFTCFFCAELKGVFHSSFNSDLHGKPRLCWLFMHPICWGSCSIRCHCQGLKVCKTDRKG